MKKITLRREAFQEWTCFYVNQEKHNTASVGIGPEGKPVLLYEEEYHIGNAYSVVSTYYELDQTECKKCLIQALEKKRITPAAYRDYLEQISGKKPGRILAGGDGLELSWQADDSLHFICAGEDYTLTSHPYEPCTYIKQEDEICVTVHNAFDVWRAFQTLEEGGTVSGLTGQKYDAAGFCALLKTALDAGRAEYNLDEVERLWGESRFRKMRRFKQQLTARECREVLKTQSRGVLAVLGNEGYPYAVPVNYLYEEGNIYFHGAKEGHKIDAIRRCDKVSFCVMDQGYLIEGKRGLNIKSVIVFGRIRELEEPEEILRHVRNLGMKYFPEPDYIDNEINRNAKRVGCLELTIEHMTGKLVNES